VTTESKCPLADTPPFPQPRACPLGIAPVYHQLRENEPVAKVQMPTGETVWLITRYDYAKRILTDPRVSSDRTHPGYPVLVGFPNRETMREAARGSLLGMDPPEHTVHRRVLVSEFTVRRIRDLRPRIQEIVDAAVDDLLAGPKPVDLVRAFSLPIPSRIVCELIGVPYESREFFQSCTKIMLSRDISGPEKQATSARIMEFYEELVIGKEKEPGDDLLSRLLVRYQKAGNYDRNQLVGLAALLVTGGHETTANMISLSTVALLQQPDQLALLKSDMSLMPGAVEEFLRYFSVAAELTGYRAALADIEIGGVLIREGDGIIALSSAANRDPDVFAEPDDLNVARGAQHHVAFGYGPHQCLGQNLARIELDVALSTLFTRIPDLRLAVPMSELPFKQDASIYGLHRLPVTW
jgi:cytochrome P450